MGAPFITIKIDVGPIGHAFVTLDDGNGNGNSITRGYYPAELGLEPPGEVRNDANYKDTGAEHPYDWSSSITLTADQYTRMFNYIRQVETSTQDTYGLFGNNCAGFVKDILDAGQVNYPQSGVHPVSSTTHPEIELLRELSRWLQNSPSPIDDKIKDIKQKVGTAATIPSPIALDLDGDGLETTAVKTGTYFDHAGDGFAEQTGWVGKDDGLLVRDLNANGTIDTGAELFGSETLLANGQKAANGFEALKELDSNHDGKVDSNDSAFSSLRIWKDSNGNGYTETGELLNLEAAGVQSINTGYSGSTVIDANGNEHRQISSYTTSTGLARAAEDVWFKVDRAVSIATDWVDVPADIAALPDATGSLKAVVTQFTLATTVAERETLLQTIIYKWVGVENIDPNSRTSTSFYGNAIGDARKLEALEEFMGEEWFGVWCWGTKDPNPHGQAAPVLLKAFDELSSLIYGQLAAQSFLKPLYDKINYVWDSNTQTLTGDLTPLAADIATAVNANRSAGKELLAEFMRSLKGMGAETSMNMPAFVTALSLLGNDLMSIVDGVYSIISTAMLEVILGNPRAANEQWRVVA